MQSNYEALNSYCQWSIQNLEDVETNIKIISNKFHIKVSSLLDKKCFYFKLFVLSRWTNVVYSSTEPSLVCFSFAAQSGPGQPVTCASHSSYKKHLAFRLTMTVLLETDARFSSLEFFLANLSKMNSKSKKLY